MADTSRSTSLTLRAILKSAASRAGIGASRRRLTGLTPAATGMLAAATALETGLVVLVVANDRQLVDSVSDARFFLTTLEGRSVQDAERAVTAFPSLEVDPYRNLPPHFDVASARSRALYGLASGSARIVVASIGALLPRLSHPARLRSAGIELKLGDEASPTDIGDRLADAGFTRGDPVDEHGEFCVRGGVVDFYPAGDAEPVRLEFVGDTLESIRRFDPATQRSTKILDRITVVPLREQFDAPGGAAASFFDYVVASARWRLLVSEPADVRRQLMRLREQLDASFEEATSRGEQPPPPSQLFVSTDELEHHLDAAMEVEQLELGEASDAAPTGTGTGHVACQPSREFRGRVGDWVTEIRRARERDETVLFVAQTAGTAERTSELLAEHELRSAGVDHPEDFYGAAVLIATGHLSRGFRLPDASLQVVAETDVFDEPRRPVERRRPARGAFLSDFRDLKVGDHVVHVDHGIGVFVGLRKLDVGAQAQEFMELRYAGEDKLFVPVENLDLVQRYMGGAHPSRDRLGGASWERAKTRVRRAMRDMAEELLKLYATRRAIPGHSFAVDSHWQEEFEAAFEYELTADQATAIADIKRDMEASTPMDRLLCGDVGYGKTEVAMRAAFKALMDGKQVALLAPTTVLTFQHATTLKNRFAAFPTRIEMLSRFRPRSEQKAVLADVESGKVDIVVGTHRLLSKDVRFRDLGLLVVDEEQRFGVAHKERLKQLRRRVDVLTLTATPIPRTLNMSLVGIRDMSVIETPPKDRLAIQTNVVQFEPQVVARAIRRELDRGGQVYFVHNRVESIYSVGDLVRRLVPEARVAVAHGQMTEDALERCMVSFVAQEFDVLVTTTIIENGLDIPNANTILVNHAERFGLSQLYQLRGRIGRSDRHAYAFLLVPPVSALSPDARKRLAAIREFSDLGSGFRVAALDLEIRGAGNLLGGEQSGHIEAVGFDMYVKLLDQAIRELKGEELEDEVRAVVNLKVDLRIEEGYIPDMTQRLAVYRKVAAARTETELADVLEGTRDRYGPLPASLANLAEYGRIRLAADRLGLEAIERDQDTMVLRFRQEAPVDAVAIVALVEQRPDLTLIPPGVLKMDLRQEGGRRAGLGESWWTARARSGEVTPGFSRDAILRPRAADPRAPDGLFARIVRLLDELSTAQPKGSSH